MMNFLPFENIIYQSKLNEYEIRERLSAKLEPRKDFRTSFFIDELPMNYEGTIRGRKFNINQTVLGNGSLVPSIRGIIEPTADGTLIYVKMGLKPLTIFTISLFSGFMGWFFIVTLINGNTQFSPLIPLGIQYIMVMSVFNRESREAKDDLQNIFEAEIL